jgi:hypothetical protein
MRQNYFRSTSITTIRLTFTSSTKLRSWPVHLSPIDEQLQIAAHVDVDGRRIECLSGSVNRVISELNEYRSALASAAVTCQIDMRGEVAP